jgi:hypothetical protein
MVFRILKTKNTQKLLLTNYINGEFTFTFGFLCHLPFVLGYGYWASLKMNMSYIGIWYRHQKRSEIVGIIKQGFGYKNAYFSNRKKSKWFAPYDKLNEIMVRKHDAQVTLNYRNEILSSTLQKKGVFWEVCFSRLKSWIFGFGKKKTF